MSQTNHLIRRDGVWYYRRRVPVDLVPSLGKKVIQFSLSTADLKEAKKRRADEDLKWTTRFEAAQLKANGLGGGQNGSTGANDTQQLSEHEVLRLVREYVERTDEKTRQWLLADPPVSEEQRVEIMTDVEIGLGILKNRDDPRGDQWVCSAEKTILQAAGKSNETVPFAAFAEWVRRGLLELERRKLGRLSDDHEKAFFDQAFNPRGTPQVPFRVLADQFIRITEEEAGANSTSEKWVDKQRANASLLREIIGDGTPIQDVDYDACLRVRSVLACVPANRNKLYDGLSVHEAITRAQAEERPLLSPVTQNQYLQTLKGILDLAARKRMIAVNPAQDMKPLKRDTITSSEKRRPFTSEQLKQFFGGGYYLACSHHQPPYAHEKQGWRFWLPLLCLFMGMRPNEVCQMNAVDVRQTEHGTWYVDVVASDDDEEVPVSDHVKVLKTGASRRRIPIHPELKSIGFLKFADDRRKSGLGARLFPDLKPDNYGNCAKYALKRFRETYLPKEITIQPRQAFYSFRHNFRDALRAIGAPPDALQALGGWSQGKLVSDDYGSKANPDYQVQFVQLIAFPGLDLCRT